MDVTKKQEAVLNAAGHVLVTGGPGSGKTTISIIKAAQIVPQLKTGQEILFLSFARATISRVIEAIEREHDLPKAIRSRITVETYHSFFWRFLKAHGYLLGLPRALTILTPAAEAIALSSVRSQYKTSSKLTDQEKTEKKDKERAEQTRQAQEYGRVCFDLFAGRVAGLLSRSQKLRELVGLRYPVIILDEFQDTNFDQWQVVQQLGRTATLIALADPEQRIYEWIGADPARLDQFRNAFDPVDVNLQGENHRSAGTDILRFGNDILAGAYSQQVYSGVEVICYPTNEKEAYTNLVTTTYAARKRLSSAKKSWSLAVLVPTKKMTRLVSDVFRSPPANMKTIAHTAAIELDGAILAAEIVAYMLQPPDLFHFEGLVNLVCNFYRGKGGDAPTASDLKAADAINSAYIRWRDAKAFGKAPPKNSIMAALVETYESARAVALTGDPDKDWRAMRAAIANGSCPRLKDTGDEARNIRLLERGTQLRQDLSEDWRNFGSYANALGITRTALVREHFSTQSSPETGVIVMNMHKAKGKQFDEVIIFEGFPRYAKGQIVANVDRIVRSNAAEHANEQAKQNLRVSITRGRTRATILTPSKDPCVLLRQRLG